MKNSPLLWLCIVLNLITLASVIFVYSEVLSVQKKLEAEVKIAVDEVGVIRSFVLQQKDRPPDIVHTHYAPLPKAPAKED